jgi:hypothetical protein
MKDTVTLSLFIKKEEQKLKERIVRLEQEKLSLVHRLNVLPSFDTWRRERASSPLKYSLREHPGDFSQSLDRFIQMRGL